MTLLVTGATGNIGRRIVDHLIDLGANDIRALTKDPSKAGLPDGVQPITGYLGNPETLPAALDGVDRMYLAPLTKTLDVTLELAKNAGVDYVVALSGAAHWQEHADKVNASGIGNTQLGPGEFLDNFANWSEQIKTNRTVREPYPTAVEAPISMDDIARVAAQLLIKRDESHLGQMYPITGPAALTRAQIAEQIGVGIGVDVRYEQCEPAEAQERYDRLMGGQGKWYLDQIEDAVRHPQDANELGRRTHRKPRANGVAMCRRQRSAIPLSAMQRASSRNPMRPNVSGDNSRTVPGDQRHGLVKRDSGRPPQSSSPREKP